MNAFMIIVMLILFILALIFVFSTALLTPYIGKKNLIAIIGLGLIVGVIGGAFLISPVVNDVPELARTIIEDTTTGTDVIELELSTNKNLTGIINNISSIDGVKSVEYDGILIKTDVFELPTYESQILRNLNASNGNFTNIKKVGNEQYFLKMANNSDPQQALDSIYNTFKYNSYAHLKYTSMTATVEVDASKITSVMNSISKDDAVILNVSGPTEDTMSQINSLLPNSNNCIIFCGVLGVIVALIGFFIDGIFTWFNNLRHKNKKNNVISSRNKNIKRKVVPGTESQYEPKKKSRENKSNRFTGVFKKNKKKSSKNTEKPSIHDFDKSEENKSKNKNTKIEKSNNSNKDKIKEEVSKSKEVKPKPEVDKSKQDVESSKSKRHIPVRPKKRK
ncbi:MAG: hypothetical protein Q4Q23_06620 [Methanobacteriaceae archaeon]|nr:hypothetical protein [Methanobacteriaceae archaeon]